MDRAGPDNSAAASCWCAQGELPALTASCWPAPPTGPEEHYPQCLLSGAITPDIRKDLDFLPDLKIW